MHRLALALGLAGLAILPAQVNAQPLHARVTTIYSFTYLYGDYPTGVIESGGSLYGVAQESSGATVFQLTPPSAPGGGWTENAVYTFTGDTAPYLARGPLVIGAAGYFYGTTYFGGNACTGGYPSGCGTVFQVSPAGGSGTVLHNFTGNMVNCDPTCPEPDGAYPLGRMIAGPKGVLYGATVLDGPNLLGMVFAMNPPAKPGGNWTESVVYAFTDKGDGEFPSSGLAMDSSGALYGTTGQGGVTSGGYRYGCGVVYKLTPPASPGGSWAESTLYTFQCGADGAAPGGDLTLGAGGVIYGTTYRGGSGPCPATKITGPGCGTVFALTPPASPGGTWSESVLYSFAGGAQGKHPAAGVTIGNGGVLYGTTYGGGNTKACKDGCGTVFSLTPGSGGAFAFSLLHKFNNADGAHPLADLLRSSRAFYGSTLEGGAPNAGTIFELLP